MTATLEPAGTQALAVLSAALHQIVDGGDPGPALAPELVELASVLTRATPHVSQDLEVRYVLGMLHWLRWLALPPEQDRQDDLLRAIAMLRPLEPIVPDALPRPLRDAFAAGNPPHAAYHDLALGRCTVYHNTGDLVALNQTVVLFRQAAATIPPTNPDRPTYLSNLGVALRTQFERDGNGSALDEALRVGRAAVDMTPADHPDRAGRLANLCDILRICFERTGDPTMLDEAIRVGRAAVAATAPTRHDRAAALSNLGIALQSSYQRNGNMAELDEAIAFARDALDISRHPTIPTDPPS